MVFKPALDFICKINNFTNPIYPSLPIIYTLTTILFIILGIAGVIAFAFGVKFKNLARNVYAFVHFITTFFSMLIIFNITYCSLNIPNNPEAMNTLMSKFDYSSVIRKANRPKFGGSAIPIKEGGGEDALTKEENTIKSKLLKIITRVIDFINNLLENNGVPIIIGQVICTSLIVVVYTFMSCIFRGISKAGYEMHCVNSNQTFIIPIWSTLIDFIMHLFLFISSFTLVFYLILKMAKDGFSAITSGFGLKPCNSSNKQASMQDVMNNLADKIDHPDIQQGLIEFNYIMNEWPVMRAIFIITLSYYLSQLFLRWLEDIISSNIVLLTSWQQRKTECSDEEDKERKTSMDRTFILVCNIVLFIIIVLLVLLLLVLHLYVGFSLLPKVLGEFPKIYIPATTVVSLPLTYESVKQTISKVSNGKVNVDKMENQLFRQLSKFTDSNGELDINKMNTIVEDMFAANQSFNNYSPITKSKPKILSEEEKIKQRQLKIERDERIAKERSDWDMDQASLQARASKKNINSTPTSSASPPTASPPPSSPPIDPVPTPEPPPVPTPEPSPASTPEPPPVPSK